MQWMIDSNLSGMQQVMAAQGPLTVYVNAYVNGEWIQGQTIFESSDVTVVPGDFLERRFIYGNNGGLVYNMQDGTQPCWCRSRQAISWSLS